MQLLLRGRVFNMLVKLGFLRRADLCHLLEEAACGLVKPHRSFPSGSFIDSRREVRYGIVYARGRSVPAGTVRDQGKSTRNFLRRGDGHILYFAVLLHYVAAFVQRVLAGNLI